MGKGRIEGISGAIGYALAFFIGVGLFRGSRRPEDKVSNDR